MKPFFKFIIVLQGMTSSSNYQDDMHKA